MVSAAVGVAGLPATFKAVQAGKLVALANKEVMVAAGELVMAESQKRGVAVLRWSTASTTPSTNAFAPAYAGK